MKPVAGSIVKVWIFSGRVVGDLLDVHAALGRGDEGDPPALPVDQQREVEFLGDVDAVGDVEPVDLLAVRPGLDGDQRVAEHLGGGRADLVERPREPHAALGVRAQLLELALAAPAGVDLRLHHVERPGKLRGRRDRLVDAHRRMAGRHRHAELREQLLGLIFVDVHGPGLKHRRGAESTPALLPRPRAGGGHPFEGFQGISGARARRRCHGKLTIGRRNVRKLMKSTIPTRAIRNFGRRRGS